MRIAKNVMSVIEHVQKNGVLDTIGLLGHMGMGMLDFYCNPYAKKQSKLPSPDYKRIYKDFKGASINIIPFRINTDEFREWVEKASFAKEYAESYGKLFPEKALEHYVGAKILEINKDDVLIDVAAAHSPWYQIAERLYGCKAYALDKIFSPGIKNAKIGADATKMPLPDNFISKIALHCAFEMFEGDADIQLLPEVRRVLKLRGRMVIIPLYMHNLYFADSAPISDRRGLDYQGAERIWRDDGHRVRFSRKYSVASFLKRIAVNLDGLNLTLYFIENEKDISPECYLKFAALFEKI
jgi:hypothetical protein